MDFIPKNCRIMVYQQPVSGRYGIPGLGGLLMMKAEQIHWNGSDDIAMVFFNASNSQCKVLVADQYGYTCSARRLNSGRFPAALALGLVPEEISREALANLLKLDFEI